MMKLCAPVNCLRHTLHHVVKTFCRTFRIEFGIPDHSHIMLVNAECPILKLSHRSGWVVPEDILWYSDISKVTQCSQKYCVGFMILRNHDLGVCMFVYVILAAFTYYWWIKQTYNDIYISIYVYMYMFICIPLYTYQWRMYECVGECVCVCVCVCVCLFVCLCVCVCVCICFCAHVHVYVRMCGQSWGLLCKCLFSLVGRAPAQ